MYISRKYINLFHVLVIAPLFYYLAKNHGSVDPQILYIIAITTAVYHFYKYVNA